MSAIALTWLAPDEEAMEACGARLAALVRPGVVVALKGELGMGKTTLSRGLLHALGHRGAVKSPTYTLVEPYDLDRFTVYHFDLYRLGDPEELEFMGVRDYFRPDALCLIEWPERGKGVLPPADIGITIERENGGRRLQVRGLTAVGKKIIREIRGQFS